MGIFALDQRTGIIALGILLTVLIAEIHRTEDIGLPVLMCLLILHGTCIIEGFHPVVSLLEVWTIACLITQTPHDDTRMVPETDHITLLTLDVHLLEGRILRKRLLTVTHTVTLQVRLCREIDTILVTEVIPTRIVWIVTSAHRIDIQLFHNLDILNHTLYTHVVAAVRIELMAIGTFD